MHRGMLSLLQKQICGGSQMCRILIVFKMIPAHTLNPFNLHIYIPGPGIMWKQYMILA
jgi:hypothetical protein